MTGSGETSLRFVPTAPAGQPASNARLIAELQAVTLGIRLVGLARLPEVMRPAGSKP